eukprot:102215_1
MEIFIAYLWFVGAVLGQTPYQLAQILSKSPFQYKLSLGMLNMAKKKTSDGILDNNKRDLLANCTEHYITQYLDHYNYRTAPNGQLTYNERYFICGNNLSDWSPNNTIFFYTGNESPVELYINNTGLMWEHADDFNAIMVFAEHRYFGKSFPFKSKEIIFENKAYWSFMSADQAMTDYAYLIKYLKKKWNSWNSPVIGFGGSYGGMICSWFRAKFPQWIDGCISGSSPVMGMMDLRPPIDRFYFANTETFDASKNGGNPSDLCEENIHLSWNTIFKWVNSIDGRRNLSKVFHLCEIPINSMEANTSISWILSALGTMSMGSYPFRSSYMLGGKGYLPPYPLRVACEYLNEDFGNNEYLRLTALGDAMGVYYNYSNNTKCYIPLNNISYIINGGVNEQINSYLEGIACGYLHCTVMPMPSSMNGVNDMFFESIWNFTDITQQCFDAYGVKPRQNWASVLYGGWEIKRGVSNIVYSNGMLDPLNGAGVIYNLSNNLLSVNTGMVGHHNDLFFSNVNDLQSVVDARKFEMNQIKQWITNVIKKKKKKANPKSNKQ